MMENEILRAAKARRSVIRFTDAPVKDEQLEAILEAGRWAPSYINSQPWEFIVVRDGAMRTKMAEVLKRVTLAWTGFAQAPVLVAVAIDPTRDPRHSVEDGAAAVQNMALAAHSLGLASFWAGLHSADGGKGSVVDEIRGLLGVPKHMSLVAVLPIGHAGYEARSSRRALAETAHAEKYGQPLYDRKRTGM
jgi:nitroreductase